MAFSLRYGKWIWAFALLLAIPATWRTVILYVHLKSDLEELLPRQAPSVVAIDEMRKRNPGLQYLGVVIDTGTPQQLAAGEKFLDALAGRIAKYPPEMVRTVRTGTLEERQFVEKHAPLYVDLDDLKEIRKRVEARRDYEVSHATGTALDDDEAAPNVEMNDLQKKYDERVQKKSDGNDTSRFSSAEQHLSMLFVEVGGFSTGAEKGRALLDRVKHDAADLDPSKFAPGMRVGYASDVAISVEELEALQEDLSLSSVLVILAVMGVIVAYYRWWKSILVLIPPLLLASVYAFALASVPPFNISELNSNTAFLGSIIIGNGINFGLILVARYREERGRGHHVEESLQLAIWGAQPGTLAAALAAGASYASLVITEFRGFRQFGYIGGLGMITSWAAAFLLMPPLLKWLDHDDIEVPAAAIPEPPASRPSLTVERRGSIMRYVVRFAQRAPVAIVISTLLLTAAAGWKVSRFDSSQLEYDFAKLRRYDTWKNGEGYWGRRMDNMLGRYLTPTIIMFDTPEEASRAEKKIRESFEKGTLKRYLASVRGIDDVLPRDQPAKLQEVVAIRAALTPAVRAAIPEDKRAKLDEILGDEHLKPIGVDDLPASFLTGLRERDGTIGRQLLVYPRPNDFLWRAEAMHEFVRTLRELSTPETKESASKTGRVAGSIPLTSDILQSVGRDAPLASIASLVGVIAVVAIVLRGARESLWVIVSLLIGVVWLGGATMALGVKINFANFIAFPITFGIGVDYAVNVIARYMQDGERDVRGAVMSTGGAVGLCSMTTIIGYSSLLLAKTRALFYFGLVAVMGEVACLTTAVIALPAFLLLLQKLRKQGPDSNYSEDHLN